MSMRFKRLILLAIAFVFMVFLYQCGTAKKVAAGLGVPYDDKRIPADWSGTVDYSGSLSVEESGI